MTNHSTYPTVSEEAPSAIDTDPRMVDLVIRQRKALSAFQARQSQDLVRLALVIRKERGA